MEIRKDYVKEYEEKKPWGLMTLINAISCNDFMKQKEKIHAFVIALCDIIDMKRHGDCQLVYFGEDPEVAGYSMTQLIETSLVSGHFVDIKNNAYIEVHSCKCYDPYVVRDFTKMFFKPSQITMNVIHRE